MFYHIRHLSCNGIIFLMVNVTGFLRMLGCEEFPGILQPLIVPQDYFFLNRIEGEILFWAGDGG